MLTGGRKALDNVVGTINALSYSVVLNMLGVYKQKKVAGLSPATYFLFKFAFANYLTESVATVSTATESAAESTATVSVSAPVA